MGQYLTPAQRLAKLNNHIARLQQRLTTITDPVQLQTLNAQLAKAIQRQTMLTQRIAKGVAAAVVPAPSEADAFDALDFDTAAIVAPSNTEETAPIPPQPIVVPAPVPEQLNQVLPAHVHVRVEVDLDEEKPKHHKRAGKSMRKLRKKIENQ